MCIKIIREEEALEFNIAEPLECQLEGAKEILVSYDPKDPKIDCFVGQIEVMAKNGITCNANIKVTTNNYVAGKKLEIKIEKIKVALDTNELIKSLTKFHVETDRKLSEMSNMCLEKLDE